MLPDTTSLLMPISPENPVGFNLEYDMLFDEIRRARESDPDYLPQGEWSVSEPRKANWNQVQILSEKALIDQSKDLQLACWFVEALCHQHGLVGMLTGLEFLSEFISRFWLSCWPSLDDDGISSRRSRLLRLDRDISKQLFCQPMLRQENTSLVCWREILAFEQKINIAPETRDDLIREVGDLTMATFERQVANFHFTEISQQAGRVEQLMILLPQLESSYASFSQDPEGELFALTRQMLGDLAVYLQRLSQRAIRVADETISFSLMEHHEVSLPAATVADLIPQTMNRELAVSQMLAIAVYFRHTEPSSPVPFLMERAARWANMTLTEWLEEMLNDSNSINDINQVLIGQSR